MYISCPGYLRVRLESNGKNTFEVLTRAKFYKKCSDQRRSVHVTGIWLDCGSIYLWFKNVHTTWHCICLRDIWFYKSRCTGSYDANVYKLNHFLRKGKEHTRSNYRPSGTYCQLHAGYDMKQLFDAQA